jgi:hypothetical protein
LIAVRVDDFPQTKGEPQHTLQAFREFDRCLREGIGGKRYLLGVIPGRCSVEDILFLRNETDCTIGMHGTDHDEKRLDRNSGNQFESYLTKNDVMEIMQKYKTALDDAVGRPAKIYMPPRNVIDLRVWDAAQRVGFKGYTSGPETDPHVMKNSMGSWIDSRPPHEYGRTDEMFTRASHEYLKLRPDDEGTVLTLHWTWETNIGLHHMAKFLAAIPKEKFCDFA